jgi:hypothetical protein
MPPKNNIKIKEAINDLYEPNVINEINHSNDLNLSRLPNEISVALISSGLNLFAFLFNWDVLNDHNLCQKKHLFWESEIFCWGMRA